MEEWEPAPPSSAEPRRLAPTRSALCPTRAPTVGLQVQARASMQRRPGLHASHRFFN